MTLYPKIKAVRKPAVIGPYLPFLPPFLICGFGVFDFSDKKIEKIIERLVKDVRGYERNRKINVTYQKGAPENGPFSMLAQSSKELAVSLKSEDGIVEGTVKYSPRVFSPSGVDIDYGQIRAVFNFNSSNEDDRKEYEGLSKVVRGLRFSSLFG